MLFKVTVAGLVAVVACCAAERSNFMLGVDANYSLDMEAKGSRWKWDSRGQDLFVGMQQHGVRWLRVRLWTGEEGMNGKQYATEVVRRSVQAGLTPYLVIFLSDDWADLNKQPAPRIWKTLSAEDRIAAVHDYSRDVITHFQLNGLTSHIYEIGNEIDYGICGIYPEKEAKKDPGSLKEHSWPEAARIIQACEDGVRKADPDAKFMLHIAHWWDADFCVAFFIFMKQQGVQIDFAGLSYFPSSNIGGSLTFEQFNAVVDRVYAAIERPVVIAETAYPGTTDFSGQFAGWRNEVPGYPITPNGQQKWLTDFVKFCEKDPKIAGVFYWSPEWYGEGMWKAFSLFDVDGNARPAWTAFGRKN